MKAMERTFIEHMEGMGAGNQGFDVVKMLQYRTAIIAILKESTRLEAFIVLRGLASHIMKDVAKAAGQVAALDIIERAHSADVALVTNDLSPQAKALAQKLEKANKEPEA